jgi:hypothetical protein
VSVRIQSIPILSLLLVTDYLANNFHMITHSLIFFFRGSLEEKVQFIFNMYDMGNDNFITKQELTTLLNQSTFSASTLLMHFH